MNDKVFFLFALVVLLSGYILISKYSEDSYEIAESRVSHVSVRDAAPQNDAGSIANNNKIRELETLLVSQQLSSSAPQNAAASSELPDAPRDNGVAVRYSNALKKLKASMDSANAELQLQTTNVEAIRNKDLKSTPDTVLRRSREKNRVLAAFRAQIRAKSQEYENAFVRRVYCNTAKVNSEIAAKCDATAEKLVSCSYDLDGERSRLAMKLQTIDQQIFDRPAVSSATVNNPYAGRDGKWW